MNTKSRLMVGITTIFCLSISGCAQINADLLSLNSNKGVTTLKGDLGDGTGYQPILAISIPASDCNIDSKAYTDGYKDGFIYKWNMLISQNAGIYSLQRNPKSQSFSSMLKTKIIGTKGWSSKALSYPWQPITGNPYTKQGSCQNTAFTSYSLGKTNGESFAISSVTDLMNQAPQ